MEYRKLPHGEEKISVLGLGSSSIGGSGKKEIARAAEMAVKNGINYFDLASADDQALSGITDRCFPVSEIRFITRSTSEQITPQENMAGLPAWIRLKNLSTGS